MNWDKDTICRMMVQMLNDGQLSLEEEAEIRGVFEERENRREEMRIANYLLELLHKEARNGEGLEGMQVESYEFNSPASPGEALSRARLQAGITQNQLSDATGITQAAISRIERGLVTPSVSALRRLAQGLGMTLNIEFL